MIFWVILLVVLVIIEIITPLELVTIWFMPAVVVSFILSMLNVSNTIIIIVFLIMSIVGLICMFLSFRKRQSDKDLINKKYEGEFYIDSISSNGKARIKVADVYHFALEEKGKELRVGDKVEAVRLEGNKIVVRKEK